MWQEFLSESEEVIYFFLFFINRSSSNTKAMTIQSVMTSKA